ETGTNPAGPPHPPAPIAEARNNQIAFFIATSFRADHHPTAHRDRREAAPQPLAGPTVFVPTAVPRIPENPYARPRERLFQGAVTKAIGARSSRDARSASGDRAERTTMALSPGSQGRGGPAMASGRRGLMQSDR